MRSSIPTPPFLFDTEEKQELKKLLIRFGYQLVWEAMDIASAWYLDVKDGLPTGESAKKAFGKLGGICYKKKRN